MSVNLKQGRFQYHLTGSLLSPNTFLHVIIVFKQETHFKLINIFSKFASFVIISEFIRRAFLAKKKKKKKNNKS